MRPNNHDPGGLLKKKIEYFLFSRIAAVSMVGYRYRGLRVSPSFRSRFAGDWDGLEAARGNDRRARIATEIAGAAVSVEGSSIL
jgi:hypothetical protein